MRIGKDSWIAVMARALFYGACMGALVGGPVVALGVLVAGGANAVSVALLYLVFGALFGVLFGFVFAIVPGLMLAAARGYFRRHLRYARLSAALVCGLLFTLTQILSYGDPMGWTGQDWAPFGEVFAGLAAIAAMSAGYVVTGRKCFVARRVFRLK